jgi:hypothetical protein
VNQHQYPYVVWQNWIEQSQMYPPDPANGLKVPNAEAEAHSRTRQFHPSPLTLNTGEPPQLTDENCTVAKNPPPDNPNLVICEEVRLNGATEDYIAGNSLWNRPGQQQVATTGGTIQFPPAAVSIKADWLRLDSCETPPQGVHVEEVNGRCYALAGMHLMSKLLPNWLWATFEPQNLSTNPNRCVVLGCFDPWGSDPPFSQGGPDGDTELSEPLARLMTQANLAPEWRNYRLNGVQVSFTEPDGRPTLLGNSILEGENAGLPLNRMSCMTCHDLSSIKQDGTDGITLLTSPPVGRPQPLPGPDWIRRDFSWSLHLACPNAGNQPCAGP